MAKLVTLHVLGFSLFLSSKQIYQINVLIYQIYFFQVHNTHVTILKSISVEFWFVSTHIGNNNYARQES